jgi:hypothetical protein
MQKFLTVTVARMNPATLGRAGRWPFAGFVAAWIASTAAATPAAAQVFEGDLVLTTQTQVDTFAYTAVTGELLVMDDGSDPITNLDGLSSLIMVGRFLFVANNPALTDVDGLSNVTQGGPALGIGVFGNDSLTNVDGLIGLTFVGEDLNVFDNASLTNVDGLSNITSVGRILRVSDNALLTDVDGLRNITSVGMQVPGFGFMQITNNDSLTDVDGLSNLTSVGANLICSGNDVLTDVDGLSSLTLVEGNLIIEDNDSLMEFCGLYPLLAADGLAGGYSVLRNLANPTEQDILNGGPCDPADTIGELFAAGAINQGAATALLQLADNSLTGLSSLLTVFVQNGILTPLEAQLLFVIASN